MTFTFSQHSLDRLATCDERLQRVFREVIKHRDCRILEGHRGQEAQNAAYAEGRSQKRWPYGEHNKLPSRAVDVAPYPTHWPEHSKGADRVKRFAEFAHFAGFVLGTAAAMGIALRWGGDWNGDGEMTDQTFDDLPHFELRGE